MSDRGNIQSITVKKEDTPETITDKYFENLVEVLIMETSQAFNQLACTHHHAPHIVQSNIAVLKSTQDMVEKILNEYKNR